MNQVQSTINDINNELIANTQKVVIYKNSLKEISCKELEGVELDRYVNNLDSMVDLEKKNKILKNEATYLEKLNKEIDILNAKPYFKVYDVGKYDSVEDLMKHGFYRRQILVKIYNDILHLVYSNGNFYIKCKSGGLSIFDPLKDQVKASNVHISTLD